MWVRALFSTAILLAWAHLAVAQQESDRCGSHQAAFPGWLCEEWQSHQTESLRECLGNRVVEPLRLQPGSEVRSVNLDTEQFDAFHHVETLHVLENAVRRRLGCKVESMRDSDP